MSFNINTLEIPQEATELTLDELKMISGGWGDDGDECEEKRRRRCKLVKKIEIRVFKCKERKRHDGCDDGCDDN